MDWHVPTSDRMFSFMVPLPLLTSPGTHAGSLPTSAGFEQEARVIPIPSLTMLPDGGLPRGAVVQLACSHRLGQGTSLALRACCCAQQQAVLRGGQPAWCAWLDPCQTLHAPGVASHGVCLERLLVVHPPAHAIGRIAVRMVLSTVFSLLVIDLHGVPGASLDPPLRPWLNIVRRLAIAARETDTCVLLLTDRILAASCGLPVALRLELEQPNDRVLRLKIAKERRGRVGMPIELAYTRPTAGPVARSA